MSSSPRPSLVDDLEVKPLIPLPKHVHRASRRADSRRKAQLLVLGAALGAAVLAAARTAAWRSQRRNSQGESRAYRLKRRENPVAGIHRIAVGRADSALDHLRGEGRPDLLAESVHEARKDLKKLRSVLRLVRPQASDELYLRENARFRDAGRALSGARDAEVKLQTLRAVRQRYEDELRAGVDALDVALEEERDALAADVRGGQGNGPGGKVVRELEAGRAIASAWPLDVDDWTLIGPGLERSYRRGRNRFADVRTEPTAENVHEWRKRVKDLWYQLRILHGVWPRVVDAMAEEAHELADLLGDHHDLVLLADDVRERKDLLSGAQRRTLRALLACRQEELLEPALKLGERIYAEEPKAFVDRLSEYWHAWR